MIGQRRFWSRKTYVLEYNNSACNTVSGIHQRSGLARGLGQALDFNYGKTNLVIRGLSRSSQSFCFFRGKKTNDHNGYKGTVLGRRDTMTRRDCMSTGSTHHTQHLLFSVSLLPRLKPPLFYSSFGSPRQKHAWRFPPCLASSRWGMTEPLPQYQLGQPSD